MGEDNEKLKLLIADDHTLFRDTLVEYILRSDLGAEISIAEGFDQAMALLEHDPEKDLVLLDLKMPGMNMEGFTKLHEKYPDILVALMSGVAEEADVRDAFERGAAGYFPKTMSGKSMVQAIKLVMTGERFLPLDHNSNSIMPSYFSDPESERKISGFEPMYSGMKEAQDNYSVHNGADKLTPREKDVLQYLAQGSSNKEIANGLDLQVVTVKLHVRGICRKLNAKNRTQAALMAREYGLLDAVR